MLYVLSGVVVCLVFVLWVTCRSCNYGDHPWQIHDYKDGGR